MSIDSNRFPYPDDDDDAVAPDVAPRAEQPIDPAEAVRREQQKYGESSLDENRDDQWDEHHGQPEDIVWRGALPHRVARRPDHRKRERRSDE